MEEEIVINVKNDKIVKFRIVIPHPHLVGIWHLQQVSKNDKLVDEPRPWGDVMADCTNFMSRHYEYWSFCDRLYRDGWQLQSAMHYIYATCEEAKTFPQMIDRINEIGLRFHMERLGAYLQEI